MKIYLSNKAGLIAIVYGLISVTIRFTVLGAYNDKWPDWLAQIFAIVFIAPIFLLQLFITKFFKFLVAEPQHMDFTFIEPLTTTGYIVMAILYFAILFLIGKLIGKIIEKIKHKN